MKHLIRTLLFAVLATIGLFGQANLQPLSGNVYVASSYNYGGTRPYAPDPLYVDVGNGATGSSTITVRFGTIHTQSGDSFMPFNVNAPITVGTSANVETVTPTTVACTTPDQVDTCVVTASFSNIHGRGEPIASGSFGLQEAINRAYNAASQSTTVPAGGAVIVDQAWTNAGGLNSTITAAVPYQSVTIEDHRNGILFWTPTQSVATALAAPATLVNSTVGFGVAGANFTGGSYTGSSTYHACIAYVDIMGNEGPCSADKSIATSGSAATDQIGFTAPAASTGAVGYTIYISLAAGSYNLTYQVPLTSTVCTLTKIETVTPACAVANTTYGQTGSTAVVSALTVNTAPLHLLATTASSTAAYIGSPSGRTTYAYAPHQIIGAQGLTVSQQAYAISPAPGSTVPTVIGTIPIPIGLMNYPGATIEICGNAVNASGGTATIEHIQFWWDAAGSNTTGAGVKIGDEEITATQVSSPEQYSFCETFQTTVSGSGVTAGSIMPIAGAFNFSEGAGTLHSSGPDVIGAAVSSLNLAGTGGNTQRIHVVYLHTTGTDAAGTTLLGLTVKLI